MRAKAALAAALALAACAVPASAGEPAGPSEAGAIAQEAYLYGFPLLEFIRVRATATSVRCPDAKGNAPVNSLSNARRFATPASRTVVAPNVDTLYSIAHLDLGRGPVVLSHPDMGSRYFSFQLLDPYTNTIGYVGTRTTGSKAGRFAITWAGHRGRGVPGARVVRSKHRRLWMIGRTLAAGSADRRRAVRLMSRYRLAPPGGPRRFAKGCRPGRPKKAVTPTGAAFLRELVRQMRLNPPPARDREIVERIASLEGISGDALDAAVSSIDNIAGLLPTTAKNTIQSQAAANGGWAIPQKNIGSYGTDYTFRAGVATLGLGANTREEAIYPTAFGDSTGTPLDGSHPYRLVFPKDPPNRAFWSLTLYDGDGYLVANPQRRYAIGDSHPPLRRKADGSVVVLLQRTKPTERNVNWLPTPRGEFRLNLRIYRPRRSVLSGAWRPPPVRRMDLLSKAARHNAQID
ncbi:MAG: DUF1254 domain-containing protein [Thermoleophilaceae bacterium]|nr:DUF1254 domain-containing protein [Thermoleophilaceae bacterium]